MRAFLHAEYIKRTKELEIRFENKEGRIVGVYPPIPPQPTLSLASLSQSMQQSAAIGALPPRKESPQIPKQTSIIQSTIPERLVKSLNLDLENELNGKPLEVYTNKDERHFLKDFYDKLQKTDLALPKTHALSDKSYSLLEEAKILTSQKIIDENYPISRYRFENPSVVGNFRGFIPNFAENSGQNKAIERFSERVKRRVTIHSVDRNYGFGNVSGELDPNQEYLLYRKL